MTAEFPKVSTLYAGCILGTIVHAIMTAQNIAFAASQWWDDTNYLLNGGDGSFGAMTFEGTCLAGTFYDPQSERNPFRAGYYDPDRFFAGAPAYHKGLAQKGALQYGQQLLNGAYVPCITTAIWNEGDRLAAAESWDAVIENGGWMVRIQLIEDQQAALREWQNEYLMDESQVELARTLFLRWEGQPSSEKNVNPSESNYLTATTQDAEALAACRHLLKYAGFILP